MILIIDQDYKIYIEDIDIYNILNLLQLSYIICFFFFFIILFYHLDSFLNRIFSIISNNFYFENKINSSF